MDATTTEPHVVTDAESLWYKDAVIYQVHVKSFFDSNDDGVGDFQGLIHKLDHLRDLGVTAVWLLPFYPSPLRDDGYDIADYKGINPSYGTMRDFRRFVKAAHERGLRVITELVINHTSDQHPWFQRAREASKGSKYRDFYVWTDDPDKWPETRIIFTDTETSNWTWDPVAKQYYWHRFFGHQPDLNFDNPAVIDAIVGIMRYWLDMGVDGLRLDAIPYLVERDGTNNENLPETHDVLKRLRTAMDESHPDAFFLAEANQWPEDTAPYFGDGDECHMAFHFPLMPRMYMAIAQEDRHPITDIMRQTPDIPANCQWAIFLRNHDELTLEMVTENERDYLWNTYAADRRARINVGIRRRLAPLMDNDRRRIELMNSLLMSMPGTPVVYYGDEIGMGDNIYVKDRDGVRTPMQWSPDRNGGFSKADPAKLFLPPVMDPIYGFDAVNVEAQRRSPSSLFNWQRRLIEVRRQHKAFGRGTLSFLYPGNRKVLAYLREHDGETLLCVVNLSRQAQAVELDLQKYRGAVPIELTGRSPFPPIGDLTYLLTLPGFGFYWFLLSTEADAPAWHDPVPEPLPDFHTLVMPQDGIAGLDGGKPTQTLERDVLPSFIANQRWFAAKDETISRTEIRDLAPINPQMGATLVDVTTEGGTTAYFLPLAIEWSEHAIGRGSPLLPFALTKVRRGPRVGGLFDGTADPRFSAAMVDLMRDNYESAGVNGRLEFRSTGALGDLATPAAEDIRRAGVEQSNSSILMGDTMILKAFRKVAKGIHPELEIGRFLTDVAHFPNVPALYGTLEYVGADGEPTALAVLQEFKRNQGDGWAYTLDYLKRELEALGLADGVDDVPVDERFPGYAAMARRLGQRTGELHRAFATQTDDPAFKAEPLTDQDMADQRQGLHERLDEALSAVADHVSGDDKGVSGAARAFADRADAFKDLIDSLCPTHIDAAKTRHHGDLHLGQLLVAQDDFIFVDFEGEPVRPLDERRAKKSPLRDVAGLLRSFDYAAWTITGQMNGLYPDRPDVYLQHARAWRDLASGALMDGYVEASGDGAFVPREDGALARMIDLFILEKALYEVVYEARNRPHWLKIPVEGALAILAGHAEHAG